MKPSLLALLGSVAYATARYNIFKGVSWNDWPTYTLNKALGLSALLLLVLSVVRKCSARGQANGHHLRVASALALAHVVLSLTLLSPAYYESFFAQGRLTAAAGWSMALGAVAAAVMAGGRRADGAQDTDGGVRDLATLSFVVGLHAMLQGFAAWFKPSQWPGTLPPITLISFVLGLTAVAMALKPKRTP